MTRELIALLCLVPSIATAAKLSGGHVRGGGLVLQAPSVIIVTLDDLGAEYVNAWGSPGQAGLSMPNLDALGTTGARFTAFYSESWCSPTRQLLNYGQYLNRTLTAGSALPMRAINAGAQTAMVGKPGPAPTRTNLNGWEKMELGYQDVMTYAGLSPAGGMRNWNRTQGTRAEYLALGSSATTIPPTITNGVTTYLDDAIADKAVQVFNDRDRSRPLILWVGFSNVHDAHWPADVTNGLTCESPHTAEECFHEQVLKLDSEIGKLRTAIAGTNTYLIVQADNGWSGKQTTQEDGIRVPAWIVGPGVSPGTIVTETVSSVDVYATALDIIKAPVYAGPDTLDGYSITGRFGLPCNTTGRCWTDRTGIVFGDGAQGGFESYRDTVGSGVENYKLRHNKNTNESKLFNLSGYAGTGPEAGDLCVSGECFALTGADKTAFNALCAGLNAMPLAAVGIACQPFTSTLPPAAPTISMATASGQFTFSWTAGAGGGAVDHYTSSWVCSGAGYSGANSNDVTPTTVAGIPNGSTCEATLFAFGPTGLQSVAETGTIVVNP